MHLHLKILEENLAKTSSEQEGEDEWNKRKEERR